uniref:Uncharacterized protein n=1 Tax=Oryza sativa subsp. indica TaxID=39946 RepID=Q0P198_ORYSI|nr:hypothetical protein TQB7A1.4 [Oryza sativa Indica Group]
MGGGYPLLHVLRRQREEERVGKEGENMVAASDWSGRSHRRDPPGRTQSHRPTKTAGAAAGRPTRRPGCRPATTLRAASCRSGGDPQEPATADHPAGRHHQATSRRNNLRGPNRLHVAPPDAAVSRGVAARRSRRHQPSSPASYAGGKLRRRRGEVEGEKEGGGGG